MRKLGVDSFVWDIILEDPDRDKLSKLELEYMLNLNTLYPNGYNVQVGEKDRGYLRNIEISQGTRERISKSMIGNNNFGGNRHSTETRRNLSRARGRSVRCLNSGKVYASIRDAYIDTGTNDRYVRDCCEGRRIRDPGHSDWHFEWAEHSDINVEPKLWEERNRIK